MDMTNSPLRFVSWKGSLSHVVEDGGNGGKGGQTVCGAVYQGKQGVIIWKSVPPIGTFCWKCRGIAKGEVERMRREQERD